jgi:excisionase family DNA binding protein
MAATKKTQLLSVAEAAERLSCSRGHVLNLVARKELRGVEIGIGRAKTRVYEADLETFIAERTRSA